MLLLISDANVLIDLEIGGLIAPMFSLNYKFCVPDLLFYEELENQHAHLLSLGLEIKELNDGLINRISELANSYKKTGRNDLSALVLAANQECPLITGDKALRAAAESEGVIVYGTIWLVTEMVRDQKITKHVARSAYQVMQNQGRRLPWDLAECMLAEID
jgi:predicted nucleic acid-binding protein